MARRSALVSLVATALMAVPAGAGAATQLGDTFFPSTANTCNGPFEVVQTGRASGVSYAAPTDGVLTSWSFEAGAAQVTNMTLRVFRPTGTPHQYTVIADASPGLETIPAASGLKTFPTRISVQTGDLVGIHAISGRCATETGNSADTYDARAGKNATPVGDTASLLPTSGFIWDISAQLEPDADADGFGDETQDQCPTDASTQGPCAGGGGGGGGGDGDDGSPDDGSPDDGTLPGVPPEEGGPSSDFSFGKVKRNKRKGTAKLTVNVPGGGELELAKTKKVKPDDESAEDAGKEKLSIKPKGQAKKKLNDKGKAKVKATVTYTPDGGTPNTEDKNIKLVKR